MEPRKNLSNTLPPQNEADKYHVYLEPAENPTTVTQKDLAKEDHLYFTSHSSTTAISVSLSLSPLQQALDEAKNVHLTVPPDDDEYHAYYSEHSGRYSHSSATPPQGAVIAPEAKLAPKPMDPGRLHQLLSKLQTEYKNSHPAKNKLASLTPKKTNKNILDDLVQAATLLATSYNLMTSLSGKNPRLAKLESEVKRDFDQLMIKLQDAFTTKATSYCNKKHLKLFPSKPKNLNTSVFEFITTLNTEAKKHILFRGIGLILQEYYETASTNSPHPFHFLKDSQNVRAEKRPPQNSL